MRKNTTLIVVGVLVVVAAITLIFDRNKSSVQDPLVNAQVFDPGKLPAINSIEIKEGDQSLVLTKNEETSRWQVMSNAPFPASGDLIVRLLEDISSSKIIRLVGEKKQQWPDLELDRGHSIALKSKGGDEFILVIGKTRTAGGSGQFVALNGSDKSYLIDKSIALNTDQTYWELKTIANVAAKKVQTIAFSPQAAVKFSREKSEDEFNLAGKEEAEELEKQVVNQLAEALEDLTYIAKLPREGDDKAFVEQGDMIDFTTFAGRNYRVLLAAKEKKSAEVSDISKSENTNEFEYYLTINLTGGDSSSSEEGLFASDLFSRWIFKIEERKAQKFLKNRKDFVVEPQ